MGQRAPLIIIPTRASPKNRSASSDKVKMVICANQPLRAAVLATERLLAEIKTAGGIHTINDQMLQVSRIFDLQGVPRMKENEKRYLR